MTTPAETTHGCRFCWMCRHVCPVGHVTHRETLTPHAWALLIDSVSRGTLKWNEETADVLYQCADCGLCRAHCATDRPLPEAIVHARAEVVAAGIAPRPVYEARKKAARWLAEGKADAKASDARGEVALLVDSAAPAGSRTFDCAGTLLRAAGTETVQVDGAVAISISYSAMGLQEEAQEVAKRALAAIERSGCRIVLVLSPSIRYALEQLYRERLGLTWPEGVTVTEVTSVLAGAMADGRLAFRPSGETTPYAYHDPCQTPRVDRDGAAPRALAAAVLGETSARRLFWREQRAHPCGAVGGLDVTHRDLADRLTDARLADASAADASLLVTEDPACLSHLRSRSREGVSVVGLYELLADHLVS